jgi:hypothetical protein
MTAAFAESRRVDCPACGASIELGPEVLAAGASVCRNCRIPLRVRADRVEDSAWRGSTFVEVVPEELPPPADFREETRPHAVIFSFGSDAQLAGKSSGAKWLGFVAAGFVLVGAAASPADLGLGVSFLGAAVGAAVAAVAMRRDGKPRPLVAITVTGQVALAFHPRLLAQRPALTQVSGVVATTAGSALGLAHRPDGGIDLVLHRQGATPIVVAWWLDETGAYWILRRWRQRVRAT